MNSSNPAVCPSPSRSLDANEILANASPKKQRKLEAIMSGNSGSNRSREGAVTQVGFSSGVDFSKDFQYIGVDTPGQQAQKIAHSRSLEALVNSASMSSADGDRRRPAGVKRNLTPVERRDSADGHRKRSRKPKRIVRDPNAGKPKPKPIGPIPSQTSKEVAPINTTQSSDTSVLQAPSATGVVVDHTKTPPRNLLSYFAKDGTTSRTPPKMHRADMRDIHGPNSPITHQTPEKTCKCSLYQAEILELQNTAAAKDTQISQLIEENKKLQTELDNTISVNSLYKDKVQVILRDCLKAEAMHEKLEQSRKLLEEQHTIGRVVPRREGMMISDFWDEGIAFAQLRQRKDDILAEKDELEKLRKDLSKRVRALKKESKEANESTDSDVFKKPPVVGIGNMDDLARQDEVYKIRLALNKKDLAEIQREEEDLNAQKLRLIRYIKIMDDERHSRFNNFPVLHQRYLLLRLLGKGGFSEVYKAFDLLELRYVACKIHQLNPQWSDERKRNYTKHATREYNIHKNLNHPRVVKLFDVFAIDLNSFCTVLEFCDGTDLDLYLKTNKTLSEREARIIIMQVFSGLKYLNSQRQRIIHYDLKPGNILFHNGEVKITDFGLSKIMTEDHPEGIELTSQGAGTYWYLPPECFDVRGRPRISSKVDVWSAGVILYQMLVGRRPFGHGMSQESILSQQTIAKAKEVTFPTNVKISNAAKELIAKCLSHNPAGRPQLLHIFDEPFLRVKR